MDYSSEGRKAGFSIGVRVRVLRKCLSHELGWNNGWEEPMDLAVGKVYTICDMGNWGIKLYGFPIPEYRFPWHVCEVVDEEFVDQEGCMP